METTTVAIDLAKDVFQVAMANRAGRILDRQRLTRRQFERFLETLDSGVDVVMESCGTSHYWGRRLQSRGLRVRLLPVQYVRPYVRRNKTDRTDTDALVEAARCEDIRPVPVKTVEPQTRQALHRVRTQWQTTRVARINAMRGLLAEHGYAIPVGARTVVRRVSEILADPDTTVPPVLRQTLALVLEDVRVLEAQIVGITVSSLPWRLRIRSRRDSKRFRGWGSWERRPSSGRCVTSRASGAGASVRAGSD